jgi:hypothetical protein
LLERLRGPTAVQMTAVLKAMTSADVVIWDDLGAEKPTEWALDRLYLLLDARYETERPLIATSNWTPSGLEARLGPRLVSRLLEMGPVWEVPGSDYRVLLAERRLRPCNSQPPVRDPHPPDRSGLTARNRLLPSPGDSGGGRPCPNTDAG